MPNFSANLGFLWPELALLDRIDAAAAAGFKAVELHWPYDTPASAVRDACARHGVALLGINTSVGDAGKGEFGLGALPGREADFQAAFDQALDYCQESGACSIHAMAGVLDTKSRAAGRETLLANLRVAGERAAAAGITILLEPINQRDKPGYFYSTVGEATSLIDELRLPAVKLMFDIYHVGVSEGDVMKKLERLMPIIGHIQIAAVPSRAEPDEGEIAFERVLRHVDALGYTGWVGCEYRPRAGTDEGLGWIKAFER